MQSLPRLIGLAGAAKDENKHARLWGKIFGFMLMVVVICLAVQWQLDAAGELSNGQR